MATDFPGPLDLVVGLHSEATPLKLIKVITQSLTPSAVGAGSVAEEAFTVNGVLSGDLVAILNAPAPGTNVAASVARVSADNEISVTYTNPTAGSLSPSAGAYSFLILRKA